MTENELTTLLFKLADINITGIKVSYSGGGDSGAIDSIVFTTEVCDDPDDVEDKTEAYDHLADLAKIDSEAYSLIEDFAQSKLLDDVEDWWNNEGGFGDLCICVPSGQYSINNNIRIVETENYMHTGNLQEKTEEE